jgi:hypothetical protein
MRTYTGIVYIAMAALQLSCDQQNSASDIDPRLGLECFESHRASLPPGTQYEGVKKYAASQITIKIMDGTDVITIDCGLNPDGKLQNSGKMQREYDQ